VLRRRALIAEESSKAEAFATHPPQQKPKASAVPVAPLKPLTPAPVAKPGASAKR
jgi:hypothetical protein